MKTSAASAHPTWKLHRFSLVVLACSVPFWWFGSAVDGVELPGRLPVSALMFVVPALVAAYFVVRSAGWAGARRFVRRLRPRVEPGTVLWWAVAAFVMPIVLAIALGIRHAENGVPTGMLRPAPLTVTLSFLMFLAAAAAEELGWTAYATDVARSYLTDVRAGLVIGAYWAAWHVIPWLQAGHPASWVVGQIVFTVLLRVLLVAVYRNTGRQVAAPVLLHATANLGLIPGDGVLYDPLLAAALVAPLVVLVSDLRIPSPGQPTAGAVPIAPGTGAGPTSSRSVAAFKRGSIVSGLLVAALIPTSANAAQDPDRGPTGWEVVGIPALNYDADEGVGYGAVMELYRYGQGPLTPYSMTVQPAVFLTTRGRWDVTLFFDAPSLLPAGWRVSAFLGGQRQLATPFYGLGNDSAYDPSLESQDNPYFYRFGRTQQQAVVHVQRSLGASNLRVLLGAGMGHASVVPVPEGKGTTLVAELLGDDAESPDGWLNFVRAGVIWDTRDRETGPTRGSWSEVLIQRVSKSLGSVASYTRWTVTDRRYVPIGSRLTFANRLLLQGISGDAPFYDLSAVQTSFKQQEGLGGAQSIRGVLKNRFVGKGMLIWNAELRWRLRDFDMLGRAAHLVVSGFVDSGRVWEDGVVLSELTSDLHHGFGGGVRLGLGDNFVVAADIGFSDELTAPVYIGLGYLY